MSKTDTLRTFLGIGVALLIIIVGYWLFTIKTVGDVEQEETTTYGAMLSYVEGSVEYQAGDGVWVRAESYINLSEGDSVETLSDGLAIINLDDGSAIRLNSETTVKLESLNPNNIVIDNEGGEVYARVSEADRFFAVVAGDVWYEAVGTAFRTIYNDKENGVEVYESTVKMSCPDKDDVLVEEGYQYYQKNDLDQDQEAVRLELDELELGADVFVLWNKEQDGQLTEKEWFEDEEDEKTETKNETNSGDLTISLSGSGNTVQWSVEGYSAKGFKVVWSKNPSPTYPTRSGDKYLYYSSPDSRTSNVTAFNGSGSYHVRVCEYLGGTCGVYSNQIEVYLEGEAEETTKETTESGAVNSIALSGSGSSVSWSVDGNSAKGFKVVWSRNSGPTYPTRSGDKYQYLSSPDTSSTTLTAFEGEGTYYVRVCEYLGGKCGVYSNQITIEL